MFDSKAGCNDRGLIVKEYFLLDSNQEAMAVLTMTLEEYERFGKALKQSNECMATLKAFDKCLEKLGWDGE